MSYSLFRKKSLSAVMSDPDGGDGHGGHGLKRSLSVRDLTAFGIAAIIGAGSFSSMGQACFSGGPGVIILFIICGIACGFTAMCYAEFASRVPVAGSAYTYAYISFGELFAWIIGWALLMEYSIGNIYVAFSWSGYFTNLLDATGLHLPEWLTTNYLSAKEAFVNAGSFKNGFSLWMADHSAMLTEGAFKEWINSKPIVDLVKNGGDITTAYNEKYHSIITSEGYKAWNNAPLLGSLHAILDLPALFINFVITWLVYVGVSESRNVSNLMVLIKLLIIILVIIVGAMYVDIDNWTPFMPNHFKGVMGGVAAVFFAYIGFDAISTLAEEAKDPQRDLPKGMIYSLVICTIAYILLSLVLTGMVSYNLLNVSDPLAAVFEIKGVKWMLYIVSIAAVVAMTSVILVFQMGQPRIWLSMSRDGLLPKKFSSIHPKHKTPGFATIITGLVVGIPLLFTNETFVLDFTSIGTLFAFVLVCGGVLTLPPKTEAEKQGRFNLPYIDGQIIVPALSVAIWIVICYFDSSYFTNLLDFSGDAFKTNFPFVVFYLVWVIVAVLSAMRKYSLIPVLGLLSCLYLLTGMSPSNWVWFGVWLVIGLIVYMLYGYRKSKLAK